MMEVVSCGPLITLQDRGRPGHLSQGLAEGGAADRQALREAEALLGTIGAGLEIPGSPLTLRLTTDTRIALTGAEMSADVDGRPLVWHAAHPLPAGSVLRLRPGTAGIYSYLHVTGGFDAPEVLGSRAAHLIANIGAPLAPGDRLDHAPSVGAASRVTPADRFGGGLLRIVETPQTRLFPPDDLTRFENTAFTRDPRGNRQGVRLASNGAGFATEGQLNLLSDFILPGDVQMTGDGVPYILGPECQTTGGYPRIGTVIAADLPRALQALPGAPLRFRFVPLAEARALTVPAPQVTPLTRDPAEMGDLLGLNLIGGVVSAKETE
ncbi:biotin-dependent carboxyltransferase family protein [Jannaschia pohangensis]|uniref:Biotin-dependent carboxylase uncharacterized domain-containing protein n=1 Tax=Jannaschia pohangensis TaxID=390807 RepID=A0A1I3S953_9RHOB|nr:biotin-dependent carboxyltransferase family protein [Jannaschia pohangensis]SFJ55363.1 biotin-dependent carboxylase uncharacterized domain-containing protein [Jannaschia pohangensis]